MQHIEPIFSTPNNLILVVLFYMGVRLYFHFKPQTSGARSLLISLGIAACLPLVKAYFKNTPSVYVTILVIALGIFVLTIYVDIRAFVRRKILSSPSKRPTPSIFFLSDLFLMGILTIFVFADWH